LQQVVLALVVDWLGRLAEAKALSWPLDWLGQWHPLRLDQ
jgi:hypothetical protein